MSKQTRRITSIGGSALIEGIMMRGPKKSTVCVRTGPDEIYSEDVSITTIPSKYKIFKIPFLRGIAGLIDSMRLSYKSLMLSADKAIESAEIEEEPSKFEKWLDEKFGDKLVKILMVIASVIGIAFAIGLFFFLPSFLFDASANVIPAFRDDSVYVYELKDSNTTVQFTDEKEKEKTTPIVVSDTSKVWRVTDETDENGLYEVTVTTEKNPDKNKVAIRNGRNWKAYISKQRLTERNYLKSRKWTSAARGCGACGNLFLRAF